MSEFSLGSLVLKTCSLFQNRMKELALIVAPAEHGIYPSEMLAMCSLCELLGVDLIIESGRQYGHSTEILAGWFPSEVPKIVSIDSGPLSHQMSVRLEGITRPLKFIRGDGISKIPEEVKGCENDCVAVLMDGPKYDDALGVASLIAEDVDLIFIHDAKGMNLGAFEELAFVTDDQKFVDQFSYLDERFLTVLGYPVDSSGGGLAVIITDSGIVKLQ